MKKKAPQKDYALLAREDFSKKSNIYLYLILMIMLELALSIKTATELGLIRYFYDNLIFRYNGLMLISSTYFL